LKLQVSAEYMPRRTRGIAIPRHSHTSTPRTPLAARASVLICALAALRPIASCAKSRLKRARSFL
jgi:hypothetical protein